MGCGQSKDDDVLINPAPVPSKEPRRSTVQIIVGDNVQSALATAVSKNILFVGGPKSGKGAVIEELVESFGVKVISAESLLHNALHKKLSAPMSPGKDGSKLETAAMLSQLKAQPSLITLEWIFELIKTEVLRYPDIVHVIDLLPNSKIILRDKTLFDNAGELLEKFEETCPVAFAMHLYIDKENLNKQLD